VLVVVVRLGPEGVEMLGRVDQVGVVGLTRPATVLLPGQKRVRLALDDLPDVVGPVLGLANEIPTSLKECAGSLHLGGGLAIRIVTALVQILISTHLYEATGLIIPEGSYDAAPSVRSSPPSSATHKATDVQISAYGTGAVAECNTTINV